MASANTRTSIRRLTQGFGLGLLTDESLNRLTDGVRSGLRDIGQTQERNKNRLLGLADRAGYLAGRVTRKGVIAAGRGVKAAGRGIGSAARAVNRVRTQADFGATLDRNKRLKGFTLSAAEYDRERIIDRAAAMRRKRFQDSQSGLGIQTHQYYSKTELAGGAGAGRNNRAAAAANAQAVSRRKKNKQAVRNAIKRQIKDGSCWVGLKEMNDRLQEIKTAPMKPVIAAMVDVAERALITNTPRVSGKLVRAITKDVGSARGSLFYDPEKVSYAPHVDAGTSKMKARHMIRKTLNQTRSQMRTAGIKAFRSMVKL